MGRPRRGRPENRCNVRRWRGVLINVPTLTTTSIKTRLSGNVDAAFPDLVIAHQNGIYAGILRMTSNREDAADLTQETFVRAYRALVDYDAERIRQMQLEGWLWTIALNLCRNRARSRSRRPQMVPLVDLDPAGRDDTEADALAGQGPLLDALEKLPKRQRECVVLRHVVGLDYAAMSEAMGRPEGTLKSDVHRGLQRLGAFGEHDV